MEEKSIKLFKAAKELNIGTGTIVDFLASKGYKIEKQPNAKIADEMYDALLKEFAFDKHLKEEAKQISIGKIRRISDFVVLEYTRDIINENLKKKDPFLDLGKCGFDSSYFDAGSELDILLRKCTHLKELVFSNVYWVYDAANEISQEIQSNNIGRHNTLDCIPPAVSYLKKLTKFICSGEDNNFWGIININPIAKLRKLTYLDLSYNQISTIEQLKSLSSLQSLILKWNDISTIDVIFNLKKLHFVSLPGNWISALPELSYQTSIEHLDLSGNEIEKIIGLDKHIKLRRLIINQNNIGTLDGLEPLLEFDESFHLRIDNNPIIQENQLRLLSKENHYRFLKEILQRKHDQSTRKDITYPVKILIFGNHSAGKSTIVNFLTDEVAIGSTHILRIVNYYSKTQNKILPDAILFDFGGQDFYHGVYRAFLSEGALQLIVFNVKTDCNKITEDIHGIPIINYNRKYWLGQKNFQEHASSIHADYIMIQTFADEDAEAPPENYSIYPGYKRSFTLSFNCEQEKFSDTDRDYFLAGQYYFKTYLDSLIAKSHEANNEPKWYVDFLQYVFDKSDKTHEPTNLDEVLIKYKVKDMSTDAMKDSLITNLTLLHRHGLVLYYKHIKGLDDFVWLDPEKFVIHIQKNVLSKLFVNPKSSTSLGIIPKTEFEAIVTDEKTILLLKEQQVIFLHQPTNNIANDEYIIPNYLPLLNKTDAVSQLFTFGLDQPNFTIKFDSYIPFGLINQMICFYGKQPDAKMFWRNQILFTLHKEIRVLIELNFESLIINVHLQCSSKCSYPLNHIYEYLFFSMMALYWNVNNTEILEFKEFIDFKALTDEDINENIFRTQKWENNCVDNYFEPIDVYISLDNIHFINYNELCIIQNNVTIQTYKLDKDNKTYNAGKAIQVFPFQPFVVHKLKRPRKAVISYSKKDVALVHKFKQFLVPLADDGLLEDPWYCTELIAGSDWNDTIQQRFDEADIIFFMISDNLMATKYVKDHEIKNAIDKWNRDRSIKIVPILLVHYHWQREGAYDLSRFTALPYTAMPITSFSDQNLAWNSVYEAIRIMIEQDLYPGTDRFNANADMKLFFEKVMAMRKTI